MDKKLKNKSFLNFLKKEGFYVVLFVCLCVVAVVAAVTAKNAKTVKEKPHVVEVQREKDTKKDDKNVVPNAVEANKSEKTNVANNKPKDTNTSKPVANTNVTFIKPVDGTLVREFNQEFTRNAYGTDTIHNGIDIQAKEGTPVYAAADGKVEKADVSGYFGNYVEIKHTNGKQVRYAALKNVAVKVGDVVNSKTKIGEVGNSAVNYSMEKYGPHLWLQVFTISNDDKEKFENPISVFTSYKPVEKK